MSDAENYGAMKYNDLKALASARGLDARGTKEELIARLSGIAGGDDAGVSSPASEPSAPESTDGGKLVGLTPAEERAEQSKADREYRTDQQKMKANLDGQSKVSIMIPFDAGEKPEQAKKIPFIVVLNGYRYENPVGFGGIQRGVRVEVPEQIAQIVWDRLESEGKVGSQFRIDRSSATQDALS